MATYFTSKLTVCGSVDSMTEFYAVLNSDSNESPCDEFRMNKFIPIPEVLFDESLDCEFSPVSVLKKSIKGRNQNISVDSMGRTEEVFNALVSCIEEEYGTCSKEEWCENNWGCEEELEVIDIIASDEISYCIKYNSVGEPNTLFILNLYKLYPNLRFVLDYANAELLISDTIEICKNRVKEQKHTYQDAYFKKLNDNDRFLFIADSDEADYCIDILGADWAKSLQDEGFSKENVENWTEVFLHLRKC
ncbi:MAG: hypothetical protein PHR83_16485 [Paludibacter sp.]|nr:hypothetical protein [Paludibacter sp.]